MGVELELTGKNNRLVQVTTSTFIINEHVTPRELGDIHAALLVIDATPDKDLAGLGAGNGVVSAAVEFLEFVAIEVLDQGGNEDCVILTLRGWNSGLAKGIETPGIDFVILVDSKAVVVASSNFGDLFALETELTGDESAFRSASNDTTGELVLLTSTPSKDFPLVVESENVVGTTADGNDLLELRDEHW